jgi:hypothetical protein
MDKSTFTFQMPTSVKNALIGISARRKQSQKKNASIKDILLEFISKGIEEEQEKENKRFSISD